MTAQHTQHRELERLVTSWAPLASSWAGDFATGWALAWAEAGDVGRARLSAWEEVLPPAARMEGEVRADAHHLAGRALQYPGAAGALGLQSAAVLLESLASSWEARRVADEDAAGRRGPGGDA